MIVCVLSGKELDILKQWRWVTWKDWGLPYNYNPIA